MNSKTHITYKSRDLHYDAIASQIRAEVQAEYAEQLAKASPLRRIILRFEMNREIRRRINAAISERSLY
jgi:hypothetical protein